MNWQFIRLLQAICIEFEKRTERGQVVVAEEKEEEEDEEECFKIQIFHPPHTHTFMFHSSCAESSQPHYHAPTTRPAVFLPLHGPAACCPG